MKDLVLEVLKSRKTKRFLLSDLECEIKNKLGEKRGPFFYNDFAQIILSLEDENIIKKIKSSKMYSSNSSLYNKYQIVQEVEKVDEKLITLLLAKINPRINTTFYFKENEKLKTDLPYIQQISEFLSGGSIFNYISLNERSYELFGDEKYLASKEGRSLQ
ncbi:hypothetical protein WKH56_06555 [Priestia sp. SB1]|uniref:hypothetical protein n=1 Tax=Priestia sp. SB1 TaxID=3132359 RepID=UPI0031798917